MRNILVVGSWAKEQITIANIKKTSDDKVFCYQDTKNPGIIGLVDGYKVDSLYNADKIIDYACQIKTDLVIITTASPLAAGIVDILQENNIRVFGPTKAAARLEYDKAFTRQLMSKYNIKALPAFAVFDNATEALDYAKSLHWRVAVKPIGLTEGLGVKVFGDQLATKDDVAAYIKEILTNKISGNARVIIEEKLQGEEFTLQCLVNRDLIIPTPAVQDFKKLLSGSTGPNTASMGSYSDANHLLPFMTQADYNQALNIIRQTMAALRQETATDCKGILYGQFMFTATGIKLIEYNFRPGDPEWVNTVSLLDNNIAQVIDNLLDYKLSQICFQSKATVCKYITPPEYPKKLNQILEVDIDAESLKQEGVDFYYSCGLEEGDKLQVGSERGIAFISVAENINQAHQKVESAIKKIKGNFYHRHDIGSDRLIKSKINYVQQELRYSKQILIRPAREEEFQQIYDLISQCSPLETYGVHFFRIILRHLSSTCFVAECDNQLAGWVFGFFSQNQADLFFLWQIGVKPNMQGKGLGKKLLNYCETHLKEKGCRKIELTVDPQNTPSCKLFEQMGYKNSSTQEVAVLANNQLAVKDFYGAGRHFVLFTKIL